VKPFMVESGRVLLRQLLVSGYEDLKRRLTRRFGSADMATEVLHETWLRLDHATEIGTVQRPKSYLYRMALNVAIDRRRADTSWFGKAELEVLLRSGDDQLDPEHIVSMRSEIAALEHVLGKLPVRCRAVFMAALVEELPYRDIAKRMGISLRSVEREMSRAFEHCGKHFEKMREGRRVGASRNVLQVDPMRDSADSHDEE
jgi:RNA polymerase sigma-70 factor (ECF subfamily)